MDDMADNSYRMDMGANGKAEVRTISEALDVLAGKMTVDRDEMVIYDISGHAVDVDDDLDGLEDDGSTGRVALIWASHEAADNDDGSHAIGEIRREPRPDEAQVEDEAVPPLEEVVFVGQLKSDGGTFRLRVSTDDARAIGVVAGDRVHVTMRRAE